MRSGNSCKNHSDRSALPAYVSKGLIPRLYQFLAPVYDLGGTLLASKVRRAAVQQARIVDGEAVLELGVGTGLTFHQLVRRNPNGRTEGIDLTPAMLRRARNRLERTAFQNYRLREGDAYELDYGDEVFDCIVSTYMVDLLPVEDMPLVLGEWTRVLRPGGRLILAYKRPGECWFDRLWERSYELAPLVLGGCRGVRMRGPMETVGLERVTVQRFRQMGLPQETAVGWKPDPSV